MPASFSIIIPVLNEIALLPVLLTRTRQLAVDAEVIVVDGGSADGTWEVLQQVSHLRVVQAPRGRARQMNCGAALATGEVLLFLHADTALPQGWSAAIRQALRDPRVVGGAFRRRFAEHHPLLALSSAIARWRGPWLVCGDQALFVRRAVFEALGGYPNVPLMEDVHFARALRRRGRLVILSQAVVTSARRYLDRGILRQLLRNAVFLAAERCGVPLHWLARWYHLNGSPSAEPASPPRTENPVESRSADHS